MAVPIKKTLRGNFPGGGNLTAEFILDTADPLRVVNVIFRYPNGGTEWSIAFVLLETLFREYESGIGDISLKLDCDLVRVTLRGEDESVEITLPLKGLKEFHDNVKKLPRPSQHAIEQQIDTALARILRRR